MLISLTSFSDQVKFNLSQDKPTRSNFHFLSQSRYLNKIPFFFFIKKNYDKFSNK